MYFIAKYNNKSSANIRALMGTLIAAARAKSLM